MKILVKFMTVVGKFGELKRETFYNELRALEAVKLTYQPLGFSNFKAVHDDVGYDTVRITATTPGGRGGRNVAYFDYQEDPCEVVPNDSVDDCEDGPYPKKESK